MSRNSRISCFLALIFLFLGCQKSQQNIYPASPSTQHEAIIENDWGDSDSPIKLVGERLFRESRFSQFFFAHSKSNFNQLPAQGDSVVDTLESITQSIVNPYKGQAISCAACHFVDQVQGTTGGGQRAYTDFTRRSPIPDIKDGQTHTVRNSPNMVASSLKDEFFLHFDGEFASPEDLIRASMTGRNMGWRADQGDTALKHIVSIIRNDDGSYPTETGLSGLSYKNLFIADASIPAHYVIPPVYRIDISKASDAEVFEAMVKIVGGYLRSLNFRHGLDGQYVGSPFNRFLRKNHFPLSPAAGETPLQYSQKLLAKVNASQKLQFLSEDDGHFDFHPQEFKFSDLELQGFKIFAGRGQCITCHAAPDFTDHLFHNTGASQIEYETVHGMKTFAKLKIPSLSERLKNLDLYLPASATHPDAVAIFRSAPVASNEMSADLGVWNVFANPAMPNPQTRIRQAICDSVSLDCTKASDEEILSRSVGMVKTPTLRALGLSQPYLHTGQVDNIEGIVAFYVMTSTMARHEQIRNADPRLATIQVTNDDIPALSAFLRALNEDYN